MLSGFISSSLYGIIRITILRKKYEDKYIFYAFPLLVGITMLLNSFFIFYKGAKGIGLDDTPLSAVVGISFGIGILLGLLTMPALPKIYNNIDNKHKNAEIQVIDLETNTTEIVELVNDTPKTLYDKIINVDINTFDKVEDKDLDIINALSKMLRNLIRGQKIFLNTCKYFLLLVLHLVMEPMMLLMLSDHLLQY